MIQVMHDRCGPSTSRRGPVCMSQGDAGGVRQGAPQYVPITNWHKATHVPYARTKGTLIALRMPIHFQEVHQSRGLLWQDA